jgi:S1-C subfamily serine protease
MMLLILYVSMATASSSLTPSPAAAVVLVAWSRPTDHAFYRVGSAFHVGNGRFYTAAHVARPSPPYPSEFRHINLLGTSWEHQYGPAAVACVDTRWHDAGTGEGISPFDVALLRLVSSPNLPALDFSDRPPAEGMLVKIVGFPEASRSRPPRQYVASGRIDRVTAEDFRIRILEGIALNGSSGSPVLTETGKVLGMIYAGHSTKPKATDEYEWAVGLNVITTACP